MNDARRKELKKAADLVEQAKGMIESVRDEEQDTLDNMPENMAQGEKGEKAQTAIDALEEAVDSCEEIGSQIETACE